LKNRHLGPASAIGESSRSKLVCLMVNGVGEDLDLDEITLLGLGPLFLELQDLRGIFQIVDEPTMYFTLI
jgi:hypothetical protein